MVIILVMNFPAERAAEMYRRYRESYFSPDFVSIKGPFAKATERGIESVTIYEFDDSRYTEAREYIYSRVGTYFGVTGLTYSADVWLDVDEAARFIDASGEKEFEK